jgi:hypothetical protein
MLRRHVNYAGFVMCEIIIRVREDVGRWFCHTSRKFAGSLHRIIEKTYKTTMIILLHCIIHGESHILGRNIWANAASADNEGIVTFPKSQTPSVTLFQAADIVA